MKKLLLCLLITISSTIVSLGTKHESKSLGFKKITITNCSTNQEALIAEAEAKFTEIRRTAYASNLSYFLTNGAPPGGDGVQICYSIEAWL